MTLPQPLKSRKLWVCVLSIVSTISAWCLGQISAVAAITAITTAASVYMGAQGYVDGQSAKKAS